MKILYVGIVLAIPQTFTSVLFVFNLGLHSTPKAEAGQGTGSCISCHQS